MYLSPNSPWKKNLGWCCLFFSLCLFKCHDFDFFSSLSSSFFFFFRGTSPTHRKTSDVIQEAINLSRNDRIDVKSLRSLQQVSNQNNNMTWVSLTLFCHIAPSFLSEFLIFAEAISYREMVFSNMKLLPDKINRKLWVFLCRWRNLKVNFKKGKSV